MHLVNVFDFKITIQQQVQKDTILQVYTYTTTKSVLSSSIS